MVIKESKLREIEDSLDLSKGTIKDIESYKKRFDLKMKIFSSLVVVIGMLSFYIGYTSVEPRFIDNSYPFFLITLSPSIKRRKKTFTILFITLIVVFLGFISGYIVGGIPQVNSTRYGVADCASLE